MVGYRSGQTGQTVNLLVIAFSGSTSAQSAEEAERQFGSEPGERQSTPYHHLFEIPAVADENYSEK